MSTAPSSTAEGPATIDYAKLTRMQKLAMFLIVIGPEAAAEILRSFDDGQIELICREMGGFPMVPDAVRRQVLEEFSPLVGESVAIYVRMVARTLKRMHYLMFMVNESRGTLASIFECVNSFADLSVRRTAPWPPEIATALDTLIADSYADWPPPVCGVMNA